MLKKSHGRFLAVGLAAVMAITSVFTTGVSADAAKASAKKVKSVTLKIGKKNVTKKTYNLTVGKKATIKVTVSPAKAKKSVAFKTSNKKIATVTKKGVVAAKKKGTAKITVTVKGKDKKSKSTYVKIKVASKPAPKPTAKPTAKPTTEPTATPAPTPTPDPYNSNPLEYSSDINPIGTYDSEGTPIYGGDPSILVDGDTVYLYVGRDVSTVEGYNIPRYCCYSTKDLKNWAYHGTVLDMRDVSWGTVDAAWAGQVMKYNGKYYMYYCSWDKTDSGRQSIGVAVADKATGPFTDIGAPLVKGSVTTDETSTWNDIDPTAWIETDANGVEHRYLSWGNGKVFVCELNEDMISVKDINGDNKITFGTQASGKTSKDVDIIEKDVEGLTYTEAPWIYRRQDADGKYTGKYYLFYAYGWREQMAYATTDDLMDGRLEFGNVVMPPSVTSNTNHMAVFDFNGKTYFVYHNGSLPAGSGFRRTPCITEIVFNEDGSITEIPETAAGINGKTSKIYTKSGFPLSHESFINSGADDAYPYKDVKVGIFADPAEKDAQWVIGKGKADFKNAEYVSIQSENKPGLYLTVNDDKTVTLAQDYDIKAIAETAKKQTFKIVKGEGNAVSYESVSAPGFYLSVSDEGVLGLVESASNAAPVFYIDNPETGGDASSTNSLTSFTVKDREAELDGTKYSLTVPYDVEKVEVELKVADTKGYLEFNGTLQTGKDTYTETIDLTQAVTEKKYTVYAEDGTKIDDYTLCVTKDFTGFKFSGEVIKTFDFEEVTDGAVAVTREAASGKTPEENPDAVYKYTDGVNNGKAITLDGEYGLKLCDAAGLGESYTISFWMKPKQLNSGVDPTLTAGTFTPQHWLNLTFDGKIWSYTNTWVATDASNAYKAGEWQNVVLVVDGSKTGDSANTVYAELYINGKLESKGDISKGVMTDANSAIYFGVNGWDAYYAGDVDEIMLINGSLKSYEVQAIAQKIVTVKDQAK